MNAEEKLISALRTIAIQAWEKQHEPLLLSALPRLLEAECPDYRDALGNRSFKKFIKATEAVGGYELIEHPSVRAKVAIAPAEKNYEFPAPEPSPHAHKTSSRETTLEFLRALAELPEADQDKLMIPTSVLTKLLK